MMKNRRKTIARWLSLSVLLLAYLPGVLLAQFGSPQPIRVQVFVEKPTLPYNFFGELPGSLAFTSTITVVAEHANGTPINTTDEIVGMSIDAGLGSGALVYLDLDPEHEDDDGNPLLFSAVTLGLNSGIASAHVFSLGPPGPPGEVVIGISVQDPNDGPTIEAVVTVNVQSGSNTALPSSVQFERPGGNFTIFTAGIGGPSQTVFSLQVVDDGGFPIPDPVDVDNVRVRFVGNRPHGGEFLSGSGVNGAQNGDSIDVQSRGGIAQVVLHSGNLPGTVIVEALVDRADNNVSDGLQIAIRDSTTIPIDDGVIRSINYAGPFVDAAVANLNVLAVNGSSDTLGQSGTYSRGIEILTSSRFGNPPIEGTTLTFNLIDGPLVPNTYPDCGRGEFLYTGADANPDEGSRLLSTPLGGTVFNDIEIGCQIMLEGPDPDQRMGRVITAILSPNDLEVSIPFPEHEDTGFTVNYTIGCPPYLGNIENSPAGFTAATDPLGRLFTHLNYPASALGHIFKASVEAQGGSVNQVVGSHYIGVQAGTLTVSASPEPLQVLQDGSLLADLIIVLRDAAGSPVPAEEIQVIIDVVDSIKLFAEQQAVQAILAQSTADAARAEANVARAAAEQARLDANLALAAADAVAGAATEVAVLSCADLIEKQDDLTSPTPGSELANCMAALSGLANAQTALATAQTALANADTAVVAANLFLTAGMMPVTTCAVLVANPDANFVVPPAATLRASCTTALNNLAAANGVLAAAVNVLVAAENAVDAAALVADSTCQDIVTNPSTIVGLPPSESVIQTCLDAINLQTLAASAEAVATRIETDANTAEMASDEQQSIATAAAQLDTDTPDPVINISSPTQSPCVGEEDIVVLRTNASGVAVLSLDIQNVPPGLNADLINTIFDGALSANIPPGEVNITVFSVDFAAPVVQLSDIQTGEVDAPLAP